ncbi:MAG TPA: NFACT RNA binding domain-containing protein [Cyclobacteriaceae bacterium]|nr:NFACT RNA binding domain-containing protein [Cyclobacteriaceae bacterium]
MHNNYYFLRQLSSWLNKRLSGYTLVSSFSQNKDELVMELNDGKQSFFVKADLQPEFQCLSFPEKFNRARKNSIDLFSDALMRKVSGVRQFANERSFAIELEGKYALVLKMHGPRSNVVLYANDFPIDIFRNNFPADLEIPWSSLDRFIDWSKEYFISHQADLRAQYFTFGNVVWNELNRMGFDKADTEMRWNILQQTLQYLEAPKYYVARNEKSVALTLFSPRQESKSFDSPLDAINDFYYRHVATSAFLREQVFLGSHLQGKLKQAASFLDKNERKLSELLGSHHYQQWGDLIMANLNKVTQGQDHISVENFYDEQKPVTIRLKRELSPQKNAEVYYRKGKNQSIEIRNLEESIARKKSEVQQWQSQLNIVSAAETLDDLKEIARSVRDGSKERESKQSLPYREFEFKGYQIWVGKNAGANDQLTLKYSFKDDLWLHSKDVAGSHVLIKYQAGKPFPRDVIERAASLAAWYSKRKNESLCPVAFTPKKYVRKRKGDPAGAVVVEREEVILVEPKE